MDVYKFFALTVIIGLGISIGLTTWQWDSVYTNFQNSDAYTRWTDIGNSSGSTLQDDDKMFAQQGEDVLEQGSGGLSIVAMIAITWAFFQSIGIVYLELLGIGAAHVVSGTFTLSFVDTVGGFLLMVFSSLMIAFIGLEVVAWYKNKDTK